MKIRNLLLIALLVTGAVSFSYAKVVDQAQARKVAVNFFFERLSIKAPADYQSIRIADALTVTDEQQVPVYHVFSFEGGGWAIITADDALHPIIGYSPKGNLSFDPGNCCFNSWMEDIGKQIQYYREQQVRTVTEISDVWRKYGADDFASNAPLRDGKDVEPLLMTTWGQGKYYNLLCPAEPQGEEGHVPVGCVATSMAQVMFYHRWPETGTGTHGYYANNPNYGNYGWQYADYGATTYNWDEMVLSPTEVNMSLATLMYHCGVAVNMSYGPTGSGSQTSYIPAALTAYFRYATTAQYIQRIQFTSSGWVNALTDNINNQRPLVYSGHNVEGGHAWNCDGYQIDGTTTLFHFNWGWDGYSDGYYNLNNLTPGGDPPYNQDNGAVRNIVPSGTSYPRFCQGPKTLPFTKGTIEDGSSNNANYNDNSDCSWLFAPADSVTKIQLTFHKFNTEDGNDIVTVYDGDNTGAPVLLTASGSTIPANTISSTSNRMLVTFTSNGSTSNEGFFASYKSIYPKYCQGTTITDMTGTVSDGSGPQNYLNSTACNWIIQPPFAKNLNLTFTYFDVEPANDYVKVYDLETQTLLGEFSGNTLPPMLTAPSGKMYIEFKSNYVYTYGGWEATFAPGNIGFEENAGISNLNIWPNPASGQLNITFSAETPREILLDLISITGQRLQQIKAGQVTGSFSQSLDVSEFPAGVYLLRLSHDQGNYTHRIILH